MSCPSLSTMKIWAKSNFRPLPSYFPFLWTGTLKNYESISLCVDLELVPLRGENIPSHAHKIGPWYLLGVLFKISDKHPRHFYIGVHAGLYPVYIKKETISVGEWIYCLLTVTGYFPVLTEALCISLVLGSDIEIQDGRQEAFSKKFPSTCVLSTNKFESKRHFNFWVE